MSRTADVLKDSLVRSASRTIGLLPVRPDSMLAMARHLREVFDRAGITVVLDVGGGRGGYRDFLRRWVGFTGIIVSFEGSRRHASHLIARAKSDANWYVRDYALWDEDAERLVEVPTDDLQTLEVYYERMALHRLDSMLPEIQRRIGFTEFFLKLDSLSRDPRLLAGAESSLAHVLGVQAELAVTGLYNGVPRFSDTVSGLRGRGFAATGLFTVPKDRRPSGADFDCVMMREAFTPDRLPS